MRRFLPFISALMLVLVLWTGSAAHAAEAIDCGDVTISEIGHFEGDRDEVPADSDNATLHHHSACHGHCVATPSEDLPASQPRSAGTTLVEATADFCPGSAPGATLRPPIA